ncbi:MAG: TonB-dependent receptor [Candidatus Omnitrophota bacterium]
MKNACLGLILACNIIFPSIVLAEDVDLDRIVVTASRMEEDYSDVSRQVDVITAKEIEKSGANDVAEALTGITSVNISNYGGPGATKNIRMRGSTSAQVLVLVDGRPINNPRDGAVELSDIPLENINRIEVMHGPGSSLYGSGAMGGTVNIITKSPPKENQKTEISSSFGTARTYIEKFSHGARIAKFGYLIGGGYQRSDGFRDNAEFSERDFNGKFEYELNSVNNLIFSSGFLRSRAGAPGKITEPDTDDRQFVLKNFQDLGWFFKPEDSTSFRLKLFQNYDRLEFMENSAGSIFDTAFKKDIHTTKVGGLDLQFDKQLSDIYKAVFGFNYVDNLNDSTTSAKHKYIVRAGYLENHLELLKDLKINFGARVDDYSNFGTQVCPDFGFLYKLEENIKFHGLIARSFRAPTFNDLYWPDEGWSKGNPNLRPEKGVTGEFGLDVRINKYLTSGLTYHRSGYKQLIQWSDNGSGVYQPENVSSAVIEGVEWLNKISLFKEIELELDYAFLKAKDSKTNKYLVYQPKHKVDSILRYKGPRGLDIELKGQFSGARYYDAANLSKVKRFFIFGFNLYKKITPNATYFIYLDNLANRKYQVIKDYPMPGFSITSGLKLEF